MTIPGPDSWAYEMAVKRKSGQWFADSNPSTFVSTRHHTVPAFILRRFAEDGRRLDIWRWSADKIKPGGVSDLALVFPSFLVRWPGGGGAAGVAGAAVWPLRA